MKKIVILDYSIACVKIMELPRYLINEQTESIESWLMDEGYKLSQIEWMCGELNIDIKL